jgi:excisionase family DNA binding protein
MDLLSVSQVAKELSVTPGRVRQLLYSKELNGQQIGWQWVITRADLDSFKENRRKPGRPPKQSSR